MWTRLHIIPFIDGSSTGSTTRSTWSTSTAFEPRPAMTWQQLNAEHVFELRWWTLHEIEAATDAARSSRARSARCCASLAEDGPPNAPVDVAV